MSCKATQLYLNALSTRPYHGTALYVKNEYKTFSISKFSNGFLEFIKAVVHLDQIRDSQIVVLYKYPSCSFPSFKNSVENHLKPLLCNQKDLVVLGDFNFNLFAGHSDFLSFFEMDFNCKQIVTKTTHDSGSILQTYPHVIRMLLKLTGLIIKWCIVLLL
jgi:hypothetical protein